MGNPVGVIVQSADDVEQHHTTRPGLKVFVP